MRRDGARGDAAPRQLVSIIDWSLGRKKDNWPLPYLVFIGFISTRAPVWLVTHCDRQQMTHGQHREHFRRASAELAAQGERVLGLAWIENPGLEKGSLTASDLPENLVLLGLIGLLDPPRKETIESVKQCHGGDIRVS